MSETQPCTADVIRRIPPKKPSGTRCSHSASHGDGSKLERLVAFHPCGLMLKFDNREKLVNAVDGLDFVSLGPTKWPDRVDADTRAQYLRCRCAFVCSGY